MTLTIRPIAPGDWPEVWAFLQPIFTAGETYTFPPDISEDEARHIWLDVPQSTFVAEENGIILGSYFIKPNQPGLGDHVCNCGYTVAERGRGKGIATAMCAHSQEIARRAGFRFMQFNAVVASNTGAVRLWQKLGFEIIGTLPGAFRHARLGLTDAHIMYKEL